MLKTNYSALLFCENCSNQYRIITSTHNSSGGNCLITGSSSINCTRAKDLQSAKGVNLRSKSKSEEGWINYAILNLLLVVQFCCCCCYYGPKRNSRPSSECVFPAGDNKGIPAITSTFARHAIHSSSSALENTADKIKNGRSGYSFPVVVRHKITLPCNNNTAQ